MELPRSRESRKPHGRFMYVVKDNMQEVDMTVQEAEGEIEAHDLQWRPLKEAAERRIIVFSH